MIMHKPQNANIHIINKNLQFKCNKYYEVMYEREVYNYETILQNI